MGTLTVRENLTFSAALRLPSSMSYGERKQRVEKVILELGLTACADTKVDTNTTKFLDLIIHPSCTFEKVISGCNIHSIDTMCM